MRDLDKYRGRGNLSFIGIASIVSLPRNDIWTRLSIIYITEHYIANCATLSDFQGRGIGTYLMEYPEKKAQTEDLQKCVLDVDIDIIEHATFMNV
jgi:ribosomal protein S18 acetylase RimI-like enzyme